MLYSNKHVPHDHNIYEELPKSNQLDRFNKTKAGLKETNIKLS